MKKCFLIFFIDNLNLRSVLKITKLDWLHSFSLGILLYFMNGLVWALVDEDALETRGEGAVVVRAETVQTLQSQTLGWSRRELKSGRERKVPNNFTEGMLGSPGAPRCSAPKSTI